MKVSNIYNYLYKPILYLNLKIKNLLRQKELTKNSHLKRLTDQI